MTPETNGGAVSHLSSSFLVLPIDAFGDLRKKEYTAASFVVGVPDATN